MLIHCFSTCTAPDMAQAGGKNPAGIPDALAKVKEVLAEQIK